MFNKLLILLTATIIALVTRDYILNRYKVTYATIRANKIQECRVDAWERYKNDWNVTCSLNGKEDNCSLSIKVSEPMDIRLDHEYTNCTKQY